MTALIQDTALALMTPALVGTAAAALRYRRTAAVRAEDVHRLKGEVHDAHQHLALRDQEVQHLADVRLPDLADSLREGLGEVSPDGVLLHPQLAGSAFGQAAQRILVQTAALVEQTSQRGENAAQAAVQSVTRVLQGLVYEQQIAISAMLDRHHDDKVLADANAIDHACSRLARKAQIVSVLTGSWPGRQREDTSLVDVVRGGISRIKDFRRVRFTGEPGVYLIGRFVEPAVLAVAELLENATLSSHPSSAVEVWFTEAHNGVSIVIDDAGIGLKPEDRALAAQLLTGQDPVRLTALRNPPRLGFLAVGVLARRYGFRVSVEQVSAHGGVRAILYLDRGLLCPPPTVSAPQRLAATAVPVPPGPGRSPDVYPVAPDGLPIRRRTAGNHRSPAAPPPSRPPTDGGRGLAAFVRGTQAARPTPTDEGKTL